MVERLKGWLIDSVFAFELKFFCSKVDEKSVVDTRGSKVIDQLYFVSFSVS